MMGHGEGSQRLMANCSVVQSALEDEWSTVHRISLDPSAN